MSSDVSLPSIEVDGWVANVLWRSSNVSRAWCDIHISQRLVFLAFSLRMIFMAHVSIWWDEDFLNSGKGVTWTGCHGKKPAHIGVCCQLIYLLRPTKCYLKALSVLLRSMCMNPIRIGWSSVQEIGGVWQINRAQSTPWPNGHGHCWFGPPWFTIKSNLSLLGKFGLVSTNLHGRYRFRLYLVWQLHDSVYGLQMNIFPFKCACLPFVGMEFNP